MHKIWKLMFENKTGKGIRMGYISDLVISETEYLLNKPILEHSLFDGRKYYRDRSIEEYIYDEYQVDENTGFFVNYDPQTKTYRPYNVQMF